MARSIARAAGRGLAAAVPLSAAAGVRAALRVADIGAGRRPLRVPIRVVRVGDAALIGMAGEQFVETGARVKAAVRQAGLFPLVIGHAQHLAYVPTPEAFAARLPSDYEVDEARRLGMAEDAADRELGAVRRALQAVGRRRRGR
jgi:hypothetical protein